MIRAKTLLLIACLLLKSFLAHQYECHFLDSYRPIFSQFSIHSPVDLLPKYTFAALLFGLNQLEVSPIHPYLSSLKAALGKILLLCCNSVCQGTGGLRVESAVGILATLLFQTISG